MRQRILLSFLLAQALLCSSFIQAQNEWDYIQLRTLAELISLREQITESTHPVLKGSEIGKYALNNSSVSSRVRLIVNGTARQIPMERKRLLELSAKTYAHDADFDKKFEIEMLFREGDKQYWIPVKTDVVAMLEKEGKGKEVILLIELVGAYKAGDGWEWVFEVVHYPNAG